MLLFFKFSIVTGIASAIFYGLLFQFVEPDDYKVTDLKMSIQNWQSRGKYIKLNNASMFYIYEKCTSTKVKDTENLIFIHGFPSSSYDFHKCIEFFKEHFNVILYDHFGFGLSDKPNDRDIYSVHDLAENSLELWTKLGIESAHIIAHDMGDSILTEILTRRHRKAIPDHFENFFRSVTFTNGGMIYELINYRVSQFLLLSSFGFYFNKLVSTHKIDFFERQQLRSIWSSDKSIATGREEDISDIMNINRVNGGNKIFYKTICYLEDRRRFERRWMEALKDFSLPVMILWGDEDSVSPMTIPKTLATKFKNTTAIGRTLKGIGHFVMLERPKDYSMIIKKFIQDQKNENM